MQKQVETIKFTSEKCKQILLARLDVVHQWLEFRKQSQNKLQADYDFVKLHNTSNSHLFEILGKISRGSLHRWYAMLNGTEDYTKLLPQAEMYSLMNILKNLPQVKQQITETKQKLTGSLSLDIVRQIEGEILGIE